MYTCHFWDLTYASIASVRTVKAKLKKGWHLCTLSMPYGGWGGCADFTHALIGPSQELMQVTERTYLQLEDLDDLDVLTVDLTVVKLTVPYAEKDLAHAAGAEWMSHLKCWAVKPGDEHKVSQWLPNVPELGSCMDG